LYPLTVNTVVVSEADQILEAVTACGKAPEVMLVAGTVTLVVAVLVVASHDESDVEGMTWLWSMAAGV
jgi:hypothetical protein